MYGIAHDFGAIVPKKRADIVGVNNIYVRLSGKYKKFEKSCSSRLISFFGQNGTKNR